MCINNQYLHVPCPFPSMRSGFGLLLHSPHLSFSGTFELEDFVPSAVWNFLKVILDHCLSCTFFLCLSLLLLELLLNRGWVSGCIFHISTFLLRFPNLFSFFLRIAFTFLLHLFIYFLATARGILIPQPGIEPCPLQWKRRVLTTGPLGKSLSVLLLGENDSIYFCTPPPIPSSTMFILLFRPFYFLSVSSTIFFQWS